MKTSVYLPPLMRDIRSPLAMTELMDEVGIADVGDTTGLNDDGFCHIVDESGLRTHCGQRSDESITCKPYNGEAVCPSCGLPTCPTCAVRTDLNNRLGDA